MNKKKHLKLLFFTVTLSLTSVLAPAHAQQFLKPVTDYLYVDPPKDWAWVYSAGANPTNFIHEYVPNGESIHEWSKFLSVIAVGPAHMRRSAHGYWQTRFRAMHKSCTDLKYDVLDTTEDDRWYFIHCKVKDGHILPGADKETRHEVTVFRMLRTNAALYQIHYSWHGDNEAIGNPNNHVAFIQEAREMVSHVKVCDLSNGKPCIGFDNQDRFLLHGETPDEEAPKCYRDDAKSCKPAVVLTFQPTGTIDPDVQTGLVILKWSQIDLLDLQQFLKIFRSIEMQLNTNKPVTVTITGPAVDHQVTAEERVKVLSFGNYLHWLLVAKKAASPLQSSILVKNFW